MRVAAPAHGERADAGERTSPIQWRRQMVVLAGLSAFFVLVQLLVVQLNTLHLGWDEVIHMSQVVPGEPARGMAPHRTRGISLVAAPVAWAIGHSTLLLRL